MSGSPHGCWDTKAIAAFGTDNVRRVLTSKAYSKEIVAIRGIFGSGKTFAQALGEVVRIHVRMDGVRIRFASANDDDAFPWKNLLQRFVGRRIRIIKKEFANKFAICVFASNDSNEIVAKQVVGKTFVANEDYRRGTKYFAKIRKYTADMFVGNFHEPVGRKRRIIRKSEPFDFFGCRAAFRSLSKDLRNAQRQYGRKSEHSSVRIVLSGTDVGIERYWTNVWKHDKPLRKILCKIIDLRNDFRNWQKRAPSRGHLMSSATEFSGDNTNIDVVFF